MPRERYWFEKIGHNEWLSPDGRFKLCRRWEQDPPPGEFLYHILDKNDEEKDIWKVRSLEAAAKFCLDFLKAEKHDNKVKSKKAQREEQDHNVKKLQGGEDVSAGTPAQRVLAACLQLADKDGYFSASYDTISKNAGTSYSGVRRIMLQLEAAEIVVIIERSNKKSPTKYGLNIPVETAMFYVKDGLPELPKPTEELKKQEELVPEELGNEAGILAGRTAVKLAELEERVTSISRQLLEVESRVLTVASIRDLIVETIRTQMPGIVADGLKQYEEQLKFLDTTQKNVADYMNRTFGVDVTKRKAGN